MPVIVLVPPHHRPNPTFGPQCDQWLGLNGLPRHQLKHHALDECVRTSCASSMAMWLTMQLCELPETVASPLRTCSKPQEAQAVTAHPNHSSLAGVVPVLRGRRPARHACQASVAHSAQATSSGWNRSRIARARSESSPNASLRVTYCEIFPGKIATKKAATIQPTTVRERDTAINAAPSTSSTIPDATTTRSAGSGSQGGTCARNAIRAQVRCAVPAKSRAAPSSRRKTVCTTVVRAAV